MQEQKLYLAYGSNLNLLQMASRCPTATVVGTSEIMDYELVFRGSKTGFYATIEPSVGQSVPVLLWSIQPQDEQRLDIYEGYPDFYEKQTMDVELDGKQVSAMVYTMPDYHLLGMPSVDYISTIANGYVTAGFDLTTLTDALHKTKERMEQECDRSPKFQSMW